MCKIEVNDTVNHAYQYLYISEHLGVIFSIGRLYWLLL
jgi:hypothetical protein